MSIEKQEVELAKGIETHLYLAPEMIKGENGN